MKWSHLIFAMGVLAWGHGGPLSAVNSDPDPYTRERATMVVEIQDDLQMTRERLGKRALSPCVLDAVGKVPRHEFVPELLRRYAYENRPLPIGQGQTISQPYIVAIMTELLEVDKESVVLEVGTGSGYQAAVLAHCVKKVFTIEIVPELAEESRLRLERLGYGNVEVRTGDGFFGWTEHAPYDAIIVTAAAEDIPRPLIEQLRPGGKMIIPVGPARTTQYLTLLEKDQDGKVKSRQLLPVAFVPLTGRH